MEIKQNTLFDFLEDKFKFEARALNFRFPIETLGIFLKQFYRENEKEAFLVQASSTIPNVILKRISGSYLLQLPVDRTSCEQLYMGLSDSFSFLVLFSEPSEKEIPTSVIKSRFFLTFDQPLIKAIFNHFYKNYCGLLSLREKKLLLKLKNVRSNDLDPVYLSKFQEALLVSALSETNKIKETKIAEAISFTGEAIVITDLAGNIVETNKTFDKQYNSKRTLFNVRNLLSEDSVSEAISKTSAQENWQAEITLKRNGSEELCLVTCCLFKDELGRPHGYVFTLKDVTDLRKLDYLNKKLIAKLRERNAQLTEVNKRLVEADRIKSDLLSVVSHELKTPISTIIGFSELLVQRVNDEESVRTFAKQIIESGRKLEKLITDYLDVASNQFGISRNQLHSAPINVADLIRVIYNEQKHKFEVNYQLEINLLGYEPIIITEAENIKKLFTNLINNAMKYSPRGGKISVKILNDGERVTISITDQGVGIPPEKAIKVFEPFYRTDNSITREFSGIGLGLPVCKKIVELYNGSIWCEPAPDSGTIFYVTLPVNLHVAETKVIPEEGFNLNENRKEAKRPN